MKDFVDITPLIWMVIKMLLPLIVVAAFLVRVDKHAQ